MTTENNAAPYIFPIAAAYKYNDVEYPINFKKEVSVSEMGALVQMIVNGVIDGDGYYPYLYNYAFYSNILSICSDFKPVDFIEFDKILRCSNIAEVVSKNINNYSDVISYVDEAIEFQKQKLATKTEFDGLISDIRKIIADVNDRFIKTVDSKTFEKLVKNLGAMKLTEKGFVDALIKAKVIDKKFLEKENKEVIKGKVINFAGQQKFDGNEVKEDEVE